VRGFVNTSYPQKQPLEGKADNLPAALAPEKFKLVIPEKKTNLLQVLANLHDVEFLQTVHRTNIRGPNPIFKRHA
jgi:hypothetical protein